MSQTMIKNSIKLATFAASAFVMIAASGTSSMAGECRFGREHCHGQFHDRLWVETFDLTTNGRPTVYHGGDVIARISQDENGYSGYKLNHVGFLVARDSLFKPRIGVFVNDRKSGERDVNSNGNIFTGNYAEPVSVDVNDCPLDFYAIVEKGGIQAYAVNFYWESPRGEWDDSFDGGLGPIGGEGTGDIVIGKHEGEHGGGYPDSGRTDLVGTAENLAANIERIERVMTPDQFIASVEPMLVPARKFVADVRACGAICAEPTAETILSTELACDGYLQSLLTAPAASPYAVAILTDVQRLRSYYGTETAARH